MEEAKEWDTALLPRLRWESDMLCTHQAAVKAGGDTEVTDCVTVVSYFLVFYFNVSFKPGAG